MLGRSFITTGASEGLLRADGKIPDSMSLTPWSAGGPLVWDATCPDTFTVSYRVQATSGAGKVAELAEEMIYSHLIPPTFSFQ